MGSEFVSDDDGSVNEVEGAASGETDKYGYMWVDNTDPEPKVEFDWIDATIGTHLTNIKTKSSQGQCSGSSENMQKYNLPFEFEFYGQKYSSLWVMAYGTLDFGDYYGRNTYTMPSTSYANGIICPMSDHIGASQYNGVDKFKVYALEGRSYGERWVCFQWDNVYHSNCYDPITFQAIIYEYGLIKFQYLDMETTYTWGAYGAYAVCGIEDHLGTTATVYSSRQPVLKSGLAIMFGKSASEIGAVNIDTDDGGALYAMHRDYTVEALVRHPVNNDLLNTISVSVGDGLFDIIYNQNPDGSYYFTENDPNGYVYLNAEKCSMEAVGDGWLKLRYTFSPTFDFPVNSPQRIRIAAFGIGVMPIPYVMEDAFWVENKLTVTGSLIAHSQDRGLIMNGGWVHGNEVFQIAGLTAVYPGTSKSPMSGAITFKATDELNNEWLQQEVDGDLMLSIVAENDFIKKSYNISIGNIPTTSDLSDSTPFIVNIDPFRPQPPNDILIHSDSFEDRNTEYDDDNEVYVSWEPAEDYESGILGYYVTAYDPEDISMSGKATWVESPDTSTKMLLEEAGTRKIWVWSVDKAGNPSVPSFAVTKIDSNDVEFSEFSPGHQIWVNTHTPISSLLITDGDGSGVSAKDVQYSVSTTSVEEYSAWSTIKLPRDAPEVRASVKTTFENGKTNWIRYRAKDVAGNGWSYSGDYNVWVDEEAPSFVNFRPYESEYQNGKDLVISVDITDKHGSREGSGVKTNTIEFRYSTGGKGLYGDWMTAQVLSETEQTAHLEMEIGLQEGKENFIQFRTYDIVGNFAISREYNVMVNSIPSVMAKLSEPLNGVAFTTTEKILFDASSSVDLDGDDLDFTWYSDINGFLSTSAFFFRALSAGEHTITLIVNDPAHSLVVHFDITVLEPAQIDPESIDSDGDGMYDQWEVENSLNPFRPDGFIDTDHDMFTNFQEYQNGTDPTLKNSHPPYGSIPINSEKDTEDFDVEYKTITVGIILVTFVIVLVLILLAVSRRSSFRIEVEEEQDLESEEAEYRNTLDRKRADRMSAPQNR